MADEASTIDRATITSLPPVLAEIARQLSVGVALGFARELGGTRLSIPKSPTPAFVRKVGGEPLALYLCGKYPDDELDVPIGPYSSLRQQRRAFRERVASAPASASEVARAEGITIRTVRRYRASDRDEPRPLPLFPDLPSGNR